MRVTDMEEYAKDLKAKNKKQMNKLTINDLPEDVLERMRRAIREDSQMISLKNKHSQYIINRQYAKAVLLKEKMQKIEDRVIREYLDSYEGETENMQSLMSDMSPETGSISIPAPMRLF